MTRQELLELSMAVPELTKEIGDMAKRYRLENATDISSSLPLDAVLAKVLEAASVQRRSLVPTAGDSTRRAASTPLATVALKAQEEIVVEFFPGETVLKGWTELCVASRVQKSNFHHYRIRGQWQVHGGLAKVAALCGMTTADLLAMSTVQAIEGRIADAMERAAEEAQAEEGEGRSNENC